jgi:uncharacterized protein with LGFP repeats
VRPAGPSATLRRLVVTAGLLGPLLVVPTTAHAVGETVVGELVQAWPEHVEHEAATEQPLTWIEPIRGEAVRVPTEDLPRLDGLEPGATVEVAVGGEVVDAPAEEGLDPARELIGIEVLRAAPTSAAATTGVQRVTVVMVRPGNVPADGTLVQEVVDAVEGPVSSYWSGQSGGAITLDVEATRGWLATTATCASPEQLFTEVDQRIGWPGVPGDRRHLLLYVPPGTPGCAYGLATVGTGVAGGGYMYVTDLLTSMVAHEFGHNFSLGHASSLQCDRTVDVGTCGLTPYGDPYEVMGISWDEIGTLGGPHASRLGLLPVDAVSTLGTAGGGAEVTLQPVFASTGVRALRIVGDDGSVYWLEYRTAVGQDSWLGTVADTYGLGAGVLLRLEQAKPDTSLLLDGTPSARADWDSDTAAALTTVGERAELARAGLSVRVTAMSPEGTTLEVRSPIDVRYQDPDVALALGPPSGSQECGRPAAGCRRTYTNGTMYWSPASGARYVLGTLHGRYAVTGPAGKLGYPVQDTVCTAVDRCTQRFQGGWIQSSSPTNVRAVWGAIGQAWTSTGGPAGPAGHPVSDERCGLVRSGCFQAFLGGTIYWSSSSGAGFVDSAFMRGYGRWSYERGRLRYPLGHTRCTLRFGGCVQEFQGGLMYRSDATGVVVVWDGAIRNRYAKGRYENGVLGYPLQGEWCNRTATACLQPFQGGRIAWSSQAGAKVVRPPIDTAWHWAAQGWPTSEQTCGLVRGGCVQKFQRASIYWSPETGAHALGHLSPQIAATWAAQGFERGRLGYPVGPERLVSSGYSQRFQGGTLVHDVNTGRVRRV